MSTNTQPAYERSVAEMRERWRNVWRQRRAKRNQTSEADSNGKR